MRIVEKLIYKALKLKEFNKNKRASLLRIIVRTFFSCDFEFGLQLGENVQFVHNGLGVVIHPKAIIDDNVIVYQNVTIGGNGKIINGEVTNQGAPYIGKNTICCAGCCLLGPIKIGENCIIGANAVITKDVPDNSLVLGNPALIKELSFSYNKTIK